MFLNIDPTKPEVFAVQTSKAKPIDTHSVIP